MRGIGTYSNVRAGSDGHGAPITCLEWSPDGTLLATGSYDGTAIIWDPEGWVVLTTLFHTRLVNGVRWSPDGKSLATACADGHCRVWNAALGKLVAVFSRHTDDVNTVAWSGNGAQLVTVSEDGTGRIWDLTEQTMAPAVFSHDDHCMSADWNPHSAVIATCGEDASIRLWSAIGEPIAKWKQNGDLEMVRWNTNGDRLAASCDDGTVKIYDDEGNEHQTLKVGGAVKSVAWKESGTLLAMGSYDGTVSVWAIDGKAPLATLDHTRIWPRAVHWRPNSNDIAVGSMGGRPTILRLSVNRTNSKLQVMAPPADRPTCGVNAVAVRDGIVLAGLDDGSVRTWNPRTQEVRLLDESPVVGPLVNAVAVFGGEVAYATFAGEVRIVGSTTSRSWTGLSPINSVEWSLDGHRIAVAEYSGRIVLLSTKDEQLAFENSWSLPSTVKSLAWVDTQTLAAGATDGLIYLVDVDTGIWKVLAGHGNLVNDLAADCGSDRKLLASASRDRTVRVWDLESRTCVRVFMGHTESVKSVTWIGEKSKWLASGSYDFDIRIWNVEHESSSANEQTLSHHLQGVSTLSSIDNFLVSGSWDGSLALWDAGMLVAEVALGREDGYA
jgi:toxoflavin biosynthesis protein ToxC